MIKIKSRKILILSILCTLILLGCGKPSNKSKNTGTQEIAQEAPSTPPGLVEVKAVGLTLEAQNEIPSGWTTFRFINDTEMIHLAFLYRLPEGKGIEDHKELAAIFQNFMDEYNGIPHSEPEAGMEIPEWFGRVVATGGPGLVSPYKTAETTVYVETGIYLIECYVKTDGIFHSYNSSPTQYGMVHEFTVTAEDNGVQAPIPTINIDVSAESGMKVTGDLTGGSHVVEVNFPDQKPHENFLGHDVHLVRLIEGSNLEEIIQWIDWRQPTGLQTPAPTAEFLGGTNELPAGGIAYFNIDLTPGSSYAWISEVPNALEKGLLVEFEVAGQQ